MRTANLMLKSFQLSANNFIRSFTVKASVITSLALLSGCLVHGGDVKTYMRETDNIHLYQADDFIEYNVSGHYIAGMTSFPAVSGTLRIEWSIPSPLYDPIINKLLTENVLKEVSTLSLNGNETTTVRYISQDMDGSIYLHAFGKNGTYYYWVNDNGTTPPKPTAALNKVKLWQSPLVADGSHISNTFHVFDNCDATNLCNMHLGYQTETDTVESDNYNIQTDSGVFNTFRVSFSGNKQLDTGSGLAGFPIDLDLRSSCGHNNANFSGTAYFYPQVGFVLMTVHCADAAGYPAFDYNFEFKRAGGSITLPSPS